MSMNVFYFDVDKYSYKEVQSYLDNIAEKFGDTIVLPKDSCLLIDCNLDALKAIREMLDKAIMEKENIEGA
jgi:hypothetical protein